jgi:hypothetical protein
MSEPPLKSLGGGQTTPEKSSGGGLANPELFFIFLSWVEYICVWLKNVKLGQNDTQTSTQK